MTFYKYKIINSKNIKDQEQFYFENGEWRFVAVINNKSLLFEKVIQDPSFTYTLPNSSGTTTMPQPNTNNPVILN